MPRTSTRTTDKHGTDLRPGSVFPSPQPSATRSPPHRECRSYPLGENIEGNHRKLSSSDRIAKQSLFAESKKQHTVNEMLCNSVSAWALATWGGGGGSAAPI